MATIENLPLELIDNPIAEEPSIFKNLNETDIINCSQALIGTRHEQYFTQKFLKPLFRLGRLGRRAKRADRPVV